MFKYCLYKFGQFLVNHLPISWVYGLTVFVSDIQYYLSPRDRKAVKNNLKVILQSEDNINNLAREVFRNFGKYLTDFFRMAKNLDQEYVKNHVTVENREYIDQALKHGKGGIVLTAHIGNWELGGVILGMIGYPMMAVALPHKERPVNDLFNRQREIKGVTVVPTSIAIRKCIETLKANKLVALLADRDFGLNGEVMDFLGKKALIPKGPAAFSLKTGAPIIPGFLIRNSNDTFTLSIEEPIFPPQQGAHEQILLELMRKCTAIIENKIRKYPTQWLMFREFWVK